MAAFHLAVAAVGLAQVLLGLRASRALLGLARIAGGVALLWYHLPAGKRHYEASKRVFVGGKVDLRVIK